jgi:hypothetical protein
MITIWLGIGTLVAAGLWAVWRWLDWGNDYYIVTNQRMVWLEKVVGLYDSRREAPLNTIQATDIHRTLTARQFHYGDVIARTYTSQIAFRDIPNPQDVQVQIDKFRRQSQTDLLKAETTSMENIIRQKINPPQPETTPAGSPTAVQPPQVPVRTRPPLGRRISNFFATRLEEGNTITYRKHAIILLKKVGLPTLLSLAVFVLMGIMFWQRTHGHTGYPSPRSILLLGILIASLPVTWWAYQLVDWRNDIYRLTPDRILDIERKPFGDEIAKSAPLENIQSLEHERLGVVGLLLNYGDVIISTSGEKFIFHGIHDPARAQQEIFDHLYALRKSKSEAEARSQHERVAEWVAAYHRVSNRDEHNPDVENPKMG